MLDNEVEKVREHKEWEVEYMTSYLREMDTREEGIEIGMERGLSALVASLQLYIDDADELYRVVIKNDAYKDTPRDEILKYMK